MSRRTLPGRWSRPGHCAAEGGEAVQEVARAGQHHVRVRPRREQPGEGLQEDLEPLLGGHPADAEEERRALRHAELLAPEAPPRRIGREGRHVHAIRDDPRALGRKAEGAHAVHELRRAAGEEARPRQRPPRQRPRPRLLGEEDVAAVEADGQRRLPHRRCGDHPVGHDPVGMDEVEALPREEPAHGPPEAEPRREGVTSRRHAPHPLVRFEGPAVAEHLEPLGRVAEGPDLHTAPSSLQASASPSACGASTVTRSPPRASPRARSRMKGPEMSPAKRG